MNAALIQRWKISETLLKPAHAALPHPENDDPTFFELESAVHRICGAQRTWAALDTLEELGDLVAPRGGFWKYLMRAAENMTLLYRIPKLQKKFYDALARKRTSGTA